MFAPFHKMIKLCHVSCLYEVFFLLHKYTALHPTQPAAVGDQMPEMHLTMVIPAGNKTLLNWSYVL